MPPTPLYRHPFSHPLFDATLFATCDTEVPVELRAVRFGLHTHLDGHAAVMTQDPRIRRTAQQLMELIDGTTGPAPDIPFSLQGFTTFEKRIFQACRTIPRGRTVSYARCAAMAGYAGAARAAANALAKNRFVLLVPCHRVIRSDGTPGGFMGSTDTTVCRLKQRLLQREKKNVLDH